MDLSTYLPAEAVLITLHLILDQITGITTGIPTTMTHKTNKATTEILTIEIEATNIIQGTTKETRATKTGMTIIKIETGSTTEDDQPNTNTTETNPEHR